MLTLMNVHSGSHKVFKTVAEAEALVATLRADDPETTYEVRPDPNGSGKAIVAVTDDGELVDFL